MFAPAAIRRRIVSLFHWVAKFCLFSRRYQRNAHTKSRYEYGCKTSRGLIERSFPLLYFNLTLVRSLNASDRLALKAALRSKSDSDVPSILKIHWQRYWFLRAPEKPLIAFNFQLMFNGLLFPLSLGWFPNDRGSLTSHGQEKIVLILILSIHT